MNDREILEQQLLEQEATIRRLYREIKELRKTIRNIIKYLDKAEAMLKGDIDGDTKTFND